MPKTLIAVLLALGAQAALAQDVYRYRDPSGRTVFSDRPPPRGTPYSVERIQPPAAQPPAVPRDPGAARDRDAFTPSDERRLEREATRQFVPAGEAARQGADRAVGVPVDDAATRRDDAQRNVPAGEARREREAVREFVPRDDSAQRAADRNVGMPADEQRRERESLNLNR
jgi:hypothetical protein